jgi:hypothetical protein
LATYPSEPTSPWYLCSSKGICLWCWGRRAGGSGEKGTVRRIISILFNNEEGRTHVRKLMLIIY